MRSEDDLRAAFTAKAGEAPSAERVAHAVRRAETQPPDRRRWLAPAIGVAAAAAVGVPLALAISHSSTGSSKKADSGNRAGGPPASAPAAGGAVSRGAASAGSAGSAESKPHVAAPNPSAAMLSLCSPDDVSVSVRREGVDGSLLIKSLGPACRIARIPSLRWPSGSSTLSTQAGTIPDKPNPANYGLLPVGGFARAAVQWDGCGLPSGNVVYVDWGNGPVKVTVAAAPAPTGCAKTPADADVPLRVSPLDGLS